MNTTPTQYDSAKVIEIAGAYGTLLSTLATVGITAQAGTDIKPALGELERAIQGFKQAVPKSMRDPILQTQDPSLSLKMLEATVAEYKDS